MSIDREMNLNIVFLNNSSKLIDNMFIIDKTKNNIWRQIKINLEIYWSVACAKSAI